MQFADLDLNKVYTYADYYGWTFEERVELIKGKVFKMNNSPGTVHQTILGRIAFSLGSFLDKNTQRMYYAPFDVRFPTTSKKDEDITTVLQPDISAFFDRSNLDERGGIGVPDIVVEILIPGQCRSELKEKFDIYEEFGVKDYILVFPVYDFVLAYKLNSAGIYEGSRPYCAGDYFEASLLPGYRLDVGALFEGLNQWYPSA